jgi:hypothetical protein
MIGSSDFRITRMPLNHGAGHMPVLGFGTLIPDAAATISATRDALEAGFRHFDGILQGEEHCVFGFCAFGSRNEAGATRRSRHFGMKW